MSGAGVGRGGGVLKKTPKKTKNTIANLLRTVLPRQSETAGLPRQLEIAGLPRQSGTVDLHRESEIATSPRPSETTFLPRQSESANAYFNDDEAELLPTDIVRIEPSTSTAATSTENTPIMRRHMFALTINSPRPSVSNTPSVTPKNYSKSFFDSEKTSRYNKRVDIKDLLNEFSATKLKKLSNFCSEICAYSYSFIFFQSYAFVLFQDLSIARVYLINNKDGTVHKMETKDVFIRNDDEICTRWTALKVKDSFNFSDSHFFYFRKLCFLNGLLPPLSQVISQRLELNNLFTLNRTYYGVSNEIIPKLKICLKPIVDCLKIMPTETIKLRLAGDGTQVGTVKKILNFTFTCLNDKKNCVGPMGNFTIGIWEIADENHEYLKQCLETIIHEFENLASIEINHLTYPIKVYFGGDMKFLLNVYGLGAANSEHCCLWCKTGKKDFCSIGFNCSIHDTSLKARTLLEAHSKYNEKNMEGYKREPLTRKIDFRNACVDILHLWLRITDKLTILFFNEMCLAGKILYL
jgi:hypothetical protein